MKFESFDNLENSNIFSVDNFDLIVSKFKLKPEFFITQEKDKIIINETWSSTKNIISANRIYEFDIFYIDIIPEEIRFSVLKEVMSIYVLDEQYEEAALIRDIINEII